jgi:hypothetical protein
MITWIKDFLKLEIMLKLARIRHLIQIITTNKYLIKLREMLMEIFIRIS